MNFVLLLERNARSFPDEHALIDRRGRLTWRELDTLANRCANFLLQQGCKAGDRLAIYLPNRPELVIALMGALKAGVTAVPLNWRLNGPDLVRLLAHCEPHLIVTTQEKAAQLLQETPWPQSTVAQETLAGSFWSALHACAEEFDTAQCQASDIANLMYTSGSSGMAKATIHTHGMRVSVAAAMADHFKLGRRDIGLAISPIFHTSGMGVLSAALFAGSPTVLLDRWSLDEFLAAIATERVSFMHLISTIIVDIASAPADQFKYDTSSVRITWGGGHDVHSDVFRRYEERVGGLLLQGYGRTEGGFTYNLPQRSSKRFDGHGFGNDNAASVSVIDPDTRRHCAPGITGEICVRGDGVSPGYWRQAEGQVGDVDGWQSTGDLGFMDADGALHFLGRCDHMIKTGGENVYPAEVAGVLLALPEVLDAFVTGIPDTRLGARVAAIVVCKDDRLTSQEIEQECRKALGGFKLPRTILIARELPRLGSLKVDHEACRRMLIAAAG